MKIRPVGADLLYTEGGTDGHDEANGRFSHLRTSIKNRKILKPKMLAVKRIISSFSEWRCRNPLQCSAWR